MRKHLTESQSSSGSYYSSYYDESKQGEDLTPDKVIGTKVKAIFDKLIGRQTEENINAESYQNPEVWEKLVARARSEWTNKLNELYLGELLAKFDHELLQFNLNNSLRK